MLLQRQTTLRLTTVPLLLLLLTFATLLRGSQGRTVDVSPEKSETITFIHDDDKIDIYRSHDDDVGKGLETDEDNEVISVRLLNSFQLLKSYADLAKETEAEGQNVSYENMLESEDGTEVMTSRNATATMTSIVETSSTSVRTSTSSSSTTSSSSPTIRSTTSAATTLQMDLNRSLLKSSESLEVSAAQLMITTTKPVILSTKPSLTTTLQPTTSTSTIKPAVITPHPTIFGTRKRTTRNHADYYQYPSIDLDQLDFDDFEYSDEHGMRLKELLATRFIPESSEQHQRDQSTGNGCPCTTDKPQSASLNAEVYDDYLDYPVASPPTPPPTPAAPLMPHHGRFARRKRLHRQQPEFSEESLAMAADASSMERVERMHGALERIMGIVTIMSHVDNFIQKKTKQSIRRLARLYESSEK